MASSQPLLGSAEPGPFELVNPNGQGNLVLLCDHASNRVPDSLGNLGLSSQQLASHIGWDPGAALVARELSARFDAPLFLSNYSRLIIDCNRWPSDPESIPESSAGISIPGNCNLTEQGAVCRRQALFEPYQAAIASRLSKSARQPRLLLSIHSFTAVLAGEQRPWSIGFAHGRDRRFAALLVDAMNRNASLVVGDNQPYSVDDTTDYTIPVHGEDRGLPHVLVELRQDGIETPADATAWAVRLAAAFRHVEPKALRLFKMLR